jgi:hypothetical protein
MSRVLTQEEEDADSYGSWLAAIAEMRRRYLAGEPIARLWREAEERQRAKKEQEK